jgi:hypothetical protein
MKLNFSERSATFLLRIKMADIGLCLVADKTIPRNKNNLILTKDTFV